METTSRILRSLPGSISLFPCATLVYGVGGRKDEGREKKNNN